MSNPPKEKGTGHENEVVDLLLKEGFKASRTETNKASHDIRIDGMPWVIESKHRRRWAMFEWIRCIRKAAGDDPWAIFASHGDRRSSEGRQVGSVVILDRDLFLQMMSHWETR